MNNEIINIDDYNNTLIRMKEIKNNFITSFTDDVFVADSFKFLDSIKYFDKAQSISNLYDENNNIYLYDLRLLLIKDIYINYIKNIDINNNVMLSFEYKQDNIIKKKNNIRKKGQNLKLLKKHLIDNIINNNEQFNTAINLNKCINEKNTLININEDKQNKTCNKNITNTDCNINIKDISYDKLLVDNKTKELLIKLNKYESIANFVGIFKLLKSNPDIKKIYYDFKTIDSLNIFDKNKMAFVNPNKKQIFIETQEKMFNEFKSILEENDNNFKIKTIKNIKILSKKDSQNRIVLKFEIKMNCNIINFLKLIYSIEYMDKWFPMMKSSKLLNYPGFCQLFGYSVSGIPLLSNRDYIMYGFGSNNIEDDNCLYILVKSVELLDKEIFNEIDKNNIEHINNICKKNVRAELTFFGFKVDIINIQTNEIKVTSVIAVDPKIAFISQSILNIFLEKISVDLFNKIIDSCNNYEKSNICNKNPNDMEKRVFDLIESETYKFKQR